MANTDQEKKQQRRLEKAKKFLQKYTQDDAALNRLIRQEECDDADRELAIILSVDLYNTITPISSTGLLDFPNLLFLLWGATIELLTMKGILMSRNRLSYSSGGLSVVVSDKAQDYQGWISDLVRRYHASVQNYKKQENTEQFFGSAPSEYANLWSNSW